MQECLQHQVNISALTLQDLMSEKVVGKMPLWFLLFIASAGLLVTISLPIDLFAVDLRNGLTLPKIAAIFQSFDQNFEPFAMVKYLGSEFPIGIAKIILLSLAIGTIIYLLYDVYERINSQLMGGRAKKILKLQRLEGTPLESFEIKPFVKWLDEVHYAGYLDFIGSMRMLTEGLLYAAETFFAINAVQVARSRYLISLISRTILQKDVNISLQAPLESLLWLGISFAMVLAFYALFLVYFATFNRTYDKVLGDFRSARAAGNPT
jgi:uncharacterized membrane protein (DUF373 family)